MKITALRDLTFNSTNLADDTTPQWNATADYSATSIRQFNNKLYTPYNILPPLCEYIYDNTDILKPHYTITAIDRLPVADNTAVYCVQNVTVVHVIDNDTYYIYNSPTGTVDFTIEDILSPANFTALDPAVNPYRDLVYQPDTTPLIWENLGYTNKYKCLDSSLSSITEFAGDMAMSFIVNKVDKIYLFNLYASEITVTVTDLDTALVVSTETVSTYSKDGGSWFNYFFNNFIYTTKENSDLPIGFNTQVDITIKGIGGISRVGLIAIGKSEFLGGTLYGAGVGIIDFSEKQVNAIGETYLKQGNFKETNNLTVDVLAGLTDRVVDLLTKYRSTPVIFEGTEDYKSTIVFGIYNKFSTLLSTPTYSKLSIDIESLT